MTSAAVLLALSWAGALQAQTVTGLLLDLGEGRRLEVEIRLGTQPIELEGIVARVERTDWIAVRQG